MVKRIFGFIDQRRANLHGFVEVKIKLQAEERHLLIFYFILITDHDNHLK